MLPALAPRSAATPAPCTRRVPPSNTLAGAAHHARPRSALFVALALVVGTRVVPWLLMRVTRTGSRELFTLCVLAIALGIAYGSSAAFGVSFALGAFFAGVILSESELSHQAGNDSLPLKDAFAVLFFVSVGMLFDPIRAVARAAGGARGAGHHHGGQVARGVRHRAGVSSPGAHRAHGLGEPGADRRVLVHSRRPRRCARTAAAGRARPDPRRRHSFHRAQSRRLRRDRAAGALDRGTAAAARTAGTARRRTASHAGRQRGRAARPRHPRRLRPRRRRHRRR